MSLRRLYEAGGLKYLVLSDSQQDQAIRLVGASDPGGKIVLIESGENGSLQLAVLDDNGLGPKYFWNGTEWSPL